MLSTVDTATPITLGKGARAVLVYTATGVEFTLQGPGEFIVEAAEAKVVRGTPPSRRDAVSAPSAVLVQRNAEAVTASVRMRSISLQKPARPVLLYPQAGPIATLHPTFAWDAESGPSGFTVVVHSSDGKFIWRGSSKSQSLEAGMKFDIGRRYSWTLSSDSGVLGTATFETMPVAAIMRAEASRNRTKTFADRVLHAFVLQDLGATQDARLAWASLARERPDLPELAVLAR
ncbi:hypothetical protein BWI17_02960 [Betaproteobacteria bacterium GR16-43]|nr:hypothetical protein BWI17_02960 [Betaproteobacteria bacterium GR16-43]